jgi:hypothetical protein
MAWRDAMMVILSSAQLVPIVERAIEQEMAIRPENLSLESRFLNMSHPDWVVAAEFDAGGRHHRMDLVLDPRTGRVLRRCEL